MKAKYPYQPGTNNKSPTTTCSWIKLLDHGMELNESGDETAQCWSQQHVFSERVVYTILIAFIESYNPITTYIETHYCMSKQLLQTTTGIAVTMPYNS